MEPSSRTTEGEPNCCPICGKTLQVEPSLPPGDAPCPHCGQLLVFGVRADGGRVPTKLDHGLADELVERDALTRWQADMLMQGKHRGFHLGPYRILRPLGQGRLSKVFLAQHEILGHQCAIKILPSRCQEDPQWLNRLRREARAITTLAHPNIVRGYDLHKDVRYGKEILFLAMEYIEGRDLWRTVAEGGPMQYGKAADLIRQAADGLAYAHQEGIVHRNIQPENLLVDPTGVVRIIDFGVVVSATFPFTEQQSWPLAEGERSAVETADYVAPEQVTDSGNVDGRADIYSLGLTFYYLLTGRRPFPKATLLELLRAHKAEQPKPISRFRPDVPLQLTDIIKRMTAKIPNQRYQTAGDVTEALHSYQAAKS
jgi:eukaryotic-like serine/threonine-protein kinase